MYGAYSQYTTATGVVTGNGSQSYRNSTYVSGNRGRPVHNMSRRERELADMQSQLAKDIKKFGRELLVHRLARIAHEKQAMLDAKSRGRSAHASTKRVDGRRMQTYEAAMAQRQLLR